MKFLNPVGHTLSITEKHLSGIEENTWYLLISVEIPISLPLLLSHKLSPKSVQRDRFLVLEPFIQKSLKHDDLGESIYGRATGL